ncbi:hypothetical protein MRA01_62670 [Methylobacterium radiotolerans]|nr:hypothetical protein MRA01_62670 [Methylobacterium radiotolerans]
MFASSTIISENDLEPGDILLYRSLNQKPHQRAISLATGSPYTHASIYLGEGLIAEATVAAGVRIVSLSTQLCGDYCVGVLRSQMGFGTIRSGELIRFVQSLVSAGARYDLMSAVAFRYKKQKHLHDQLDLLKKNFGDFIHEEELIKDSYFCSALVVACYYVVGIIHQSAQIVYPHKLISPADLHRDPTFGWFLGYLLPPGAKIPAGDPLEHITSWADINRA